MNMICPYCGQPMEKGFVMTNLRYSIFWLPETADKVPLIIDRDRSGNGAEGSDSCRPRARFQKNAPMEHDCNSERDVCLQGLQKRYYKYVIMQRIRWAEFFRLPFFIFSTDAFWES